jgi:hypothetical protein
MPEYKPEDITNPDGTTKAVAMYNISQDTNYVPEKNKNPDGTYKAIPIFVVNGNGGAYVATTSTAAATAIKVVDGLPADYTPIKGDFLTLKFLVASSVASPKVNINGVAYFLTWKTANLTSSVYYTIAINQTILTQFNGTTFEFLHEPDWTDTDTFDRIRFGGNASVAGMAILAYQICGIADDGKAYPLFNNTAKTVSDKIYKLDNNYFVQTAALAINAYFTTAAYQQLYTSSTTYVPAMVGTLTTTDYGKDLYLVGTISGAGFKLDNTSETSWRTTTLPTSEDGKIYIKLGVVGSTVSMFTITQGHTPMWYKDGTFKLYVKEIKDAVAKTTLVAADTIAITDSAASNITKKITWANFIVLLNTLYNKITVNNTLTSTSTTEALSAAQGKALNDAKVAKTGDTMSGALSNSLYTQTYLAGNQGKSLLASVVTIAGGFVSLIRTISTNGYFQLVSYQKAFNLYYTTKEIVDAGTNFVTRTATLLDEDGNTAFPVKVTAPTFAGALSGNATTATKLATARTINGVSFDGTTNIALRPQVFYGTTLTAAATAIKVVDGLPADYVPATGDVLNCYFTLTNSVASPQLSINGVSYYLQYNGANITGSSNYAIPAKFTINVVFNGTAWQFVTLPYWKDADTITNTNIGANTLIAGEIITQYKLIAKGVDGKLHPLCIGDVTTATKTVSTQIFDLSTPVFLKIATGSTAVDGKLAATMYYEYYYSSANVQYAFNGFASTDLNKQLYLVGTITGGGFKLDNTSLTSWYTTTIPTTVDGKVYKPIGYIGDSATIFNLTNLGQLMQFRDGIFRPF